MTHLIPHGYKPSSLGPIPQDWEIAELGKTFEFISTYSFSRENLTYEDTDNRLYYIHYGDIHAKYNNTLLDFEAHNSTPFLRDEFYFNSFSFLKNGDLVIADASEDYKGIGSSIEIKNLGNKKVIGGLHTIVLRDKTYKTVDGFRGYLFKNQSTIKEMWKVATGISVLGISKTNLSKLKLYLPPVTEQHAIASILSTCDESIATTQTLIDHLKRRHKALCLQVLTGKKRLQGFGEKRKIVSLNECLEYIPRAVEKPSGSFFALGIRSHGKGIFHKNDFDPEDIAMDTLYEVKKDDLILNITFAREQAVAIASQKDDGGLVSHRFPTYIFKLNKAIPEYFRHFILQKRFKYMLDLISPGGAGRNRVLSKKDFLKLEVCIPSPEEQHAIASILNDSQSQINLAQSKLTKLKQQKQGLMQQLLTGKTRVPSDYL